MTEQWRIRIFLSILLLETRVSEENYYAITLFVQGVIFREIRTVTRQRVQINNSNSNS